MEMGSKKEVNIIEPQGEVYQCPSCGYQDGFHISFKWNQDDSEGEIYLICIGWKIKSPSQKEGNG